MSKVFQKTIIDQTALNTSKLMINISWNVLFDHGDYIDNQWKYEQFLAQPFTKQEIKLCMWGTSLTYSVTYLLTHSCGSLDQSVNIDASALKFGI